MRVGTLVVAGLGVRFMNKNYAANGVHVPETSQLVCLPKQLTSRWTAKDHHNISRR